MPYDRAYDYATPSFFGGGFGFTCAPPPTNTTRSDRVSAYGASRNDSISNSRTRDFASSRQSSINQSLSRADSLAGSQRGSFDRADSLSSRPPLTRMESLGRSNVSSVTSSTSGPKSTITSTSRAGPGTVTSTSEYETGPDGRPSHYSSTVYKSPYGKTHRFNSHF